MQLFLIVLFGLVSFVLAISLAVTGVKFQEIAPLQRALLLFGAAALSVPGLMSMYMLLIFGAILSQ